MLSFERERKFLHKTCNKPESITVLSTRNELYQHFRKRKKHVFIENKAKITNQCSFAVTVIKPHTESQYSRFLQDVHDIVLPYYTMYAMIYNRGFLSVRKYFS